MNSNITTILFDLDGTLIDTNELIIQSFTHTFDHFYPGRFARADLIPFMGPTLTETFSSVDKEKTEEMIAMYREFNNSQHDHYVKEFEGVFETVKTLHEQGYKLAIVTTKILFTAMKGLKLARLEPFFDCVIALDHVEKTKPDPEPIRKALAQLGSTPEEAIMVGDNHHDIVGGKNAGTKTAAVAWSLKGEAFLQQYQPDYMLQNMSDLLDIIGVEQK